MHCTHCMQLQVIFQKWPKIALELTFKLEYHIPLDLALMAGASVGPKRDSALIPPVYINPQPSSIYVRMDWGTRLIELFELFWRALGFSAGGFQYQLFARIQEKLSDRVVWGVREAL